MDGDSVDIGVVDKPDDLVGEELAVVLGAEVGLGGLGGVQLQPLPDPLPQHVQRRVRLHDLRHRLLDQRLGSREPVAIRTALGEKYQYIRYTVKRNTILLQTNQLYDC